MDTTRDAEETRDGNDEREEGEGRGVEAEEARAKGEEEDARRFPASPRRGRAGATTYGGGGWNAKDELSVYQCARMLA